MTDLPPPTPPSTSNSQGDDKTLAILTHLSGIILGFIVPLVIWLVKKDQSQYLADQAKEALNFQITVLIGYIAGFILSFVLIGLLIMPAVMIANLVLCIIAAVKTSNGENYRYPLTLRLIN